MVSYHYVFLTISNIAQYRYTKTELGKVSTSVLPFGKVTNAWCLYTAKRIALFHMTAPLGTAFSGYLVSISALEKRSDIDKSPSKPQYTQT